MSAQAVGAERRGRHARLRSLWERLPGRWQHHALDLFRCADGLRYGARRALAAPFLPALDSVMPLLAPGEFVARRVVLANSSLTWGGAERQVVNTLDGLAGAGLESVSLLCLHLELTPEHSFYRQQIRAAGMDIVEAGAGVAPEQLPAPLRERLPRVEHYLQRFPPGIARYTRRFLLDMLVRRPAVVHAWQDYCAITAGLAALIAGVPTIIIGGRNLNPTNFAYYRACMPDIYRLLLRSPRVCFVNNSAAGAADYARWLGEPAGRFGVLRNGIDETAVTRAAPAEVAAYRASLGIPAAAPVVGGVFRLYPEKDPALWLAAQARVAAARPEAHFLLVGTGPLEIAVRRDAAALGLAHRLHLPGPTKDVALPISAMDVLVLTSHSEGTPNVVLEAGLLGVPVVATDAGGTRESFAPGRTGWLVEARDPDAIAARILQVLADPAWAAAAAAAAPPFVRERFGMARMIAETLAIYGIAPAKADENPAR